MQTQASELALTVSRDRMEGPGQECAVCRHHGLCSLPMQTSVIFDIKLRGEFDGTVTFHHPVLPARSIQPYQIPLAGKMEPRRAVCASSLP